VKHEPFFSFFPQTIQSLDIFEGAKRNCGQALSFAAGKKSRTMSSGQQAYLNTDWPELVKGPTIGSLTFI